MDRPIRRKHFSLYILTKPSLTSTRSPKLRGGNTEVEKYNCAFHYVLPIVTETPDGASFNLSIVVEICDG